MEVTAGQTCTLSELEEREGIHESYISWKEEDKYW